MAGAFLCPQVGGVEAVGDQGLGDCESCDGSEGGDGVVANDLDGEVDPEAEADLGEFVVAEDLCDFGGGVVGGGALAD